MTSSKCNTELPNLVKSAVSYLQEDLGFICGSFLGKGTYGSVVRVISREAVPFAAKIVERRLVNEMEVMIWPKLNHENVLKLFEVIIDVEGVVIFLTDLMATNLFLRLQNSEFKQDPQALDKCRIYARQVFSGVSYLHRQSLCHLDLRAENIFLASEDDRAVVADFSGLSWSERERRFCPLPQALRPPELLTGKRRVSPQPVDLWSCGLLLANIFLGKGFYICTLKNSRAGHIEAVHQYTECFQSEAYVKKFLFTTYASCTLSQTSIKNFIHIVHRFLEMNPRNRLRTDEALSHPFLCKPSRKVKPDKVILKVNKDAPQPVIEKTDNSNLSGDSSATFQVKFIEISAQETQSSVGNKNLTGRNEKISRWSKYKRRFSNFKRAFRSVPFLKSIKTKKEEKKKSKKSEKLEDE